MRQSVWLDYLHRKAIEDGELAEMITHGGVTGVTSNPSIFEKAIAGDWLYSDRIGHLLEARAMTAGELYEAVAIDDIRAAADLLRPVYDRTGGRDGFTSLEVSPYLADDTDGTILEARRLWAAVDRPNLMVKVPGTAAGLPAIARLIEEGVNVNVTLLFSTDTYRQVAEAFLTGLAHRVANGKDVSRVQSVASFFVSRVDSKADKVLRDPALRGKVGIANAKRAFRLYQAIFGSPRWEALAKKGAQTQRLLWASTSVKNPAYPALLYVEELMGPDTVDTMPPATYQEFRKKGSAPDRLGGGWEQAEEVLTRSKAAGLDYEALTQDLLSEGLASFKTAFDQLLAAVEHRRREFLGRRLNACETRLPKDLEQAVAHEAEAWRQEGKIRRLWAGDATLWSGTSESQWLGWLGSVPRETSRIPLYEKIALDAVASGIKSVVVLGMGGSSLCPDVLARTFGKLPKHPELFVLDATSPDQIRSVESRLDLATTLFVVSSKSGSTLEPDILRDYFLALMRRAVGDRAPRHFLAVTDPGSKLEAQARETGFRSVIPGEPSIGGRYSALSPFGLVPAALMGLDVRRFLDGARLMVQSCDALVPPAENPGVQLGLVLGVAAKQGRNKVTFVADPSYEALGAWLEQLLAESTGKDGKGIVPVDQEPIGRPEDYGNDRVFVYLGAADDEAASQHMKVRALEAAGHPVVWITVADPYALGQEFFRWEIATAVAGAVIGINPFDQPDVEAAKVATRRLADGPVPDAPPPVTDADLASLLADPHAGDYVAICAFIERCELHRSELQRLRQLILDGRHLATCGGFGPRYLHSTGQAYKGGPANGRFLIITADPAHDLAVPGKSYTFGQIQQMQGLGDFEVLAERGRKALRVHLAGDVEDGLIDLRLRVGCLLKAAAPQP